MAAAAARTCANVEAACTAGPTASGISVAPEFVQLDRVLNTEYSQNFKPEGVLPAPPIPAVDSLVGAAGLELESVAGMIKYLYSAVAEKVWCRSEAQSFRRWCYEWRRAGQQPRPSLVAVGEAGLESKLWTMAMWPRRACGRILAHSYAMHGNSAAHRLQAQRCIYSPLSCPCRRVHAPCWATSTALPEPSAGSIVRRTGRV